MVGLQAFAVAAKFCAASSSTGLLHFKNNHSVRKSTYALILMHCTESTDSSRHGFCANAGMAPAGATRSPLAGRIGLLDNGGWQNQGQLEELAKSSLS